LAKAPRRCELAMQYFLFGKPEVWLRIPLFHNTHLTTNDCMDAGGRATHGAVAENTKRTKKNQRVKELHKLI
jgi:hypothetical protein